MHIGYVDECMGPACPENSATCCTEYNKKYKYNQTYKYKPARTLDVLTRGWGSPVRSIPPPVAPNRQLVLRPLPTPPCSSAFSQYHPDPGNGRSSHYSLLLQFLFDFWQLFWTQFPVETFHHSVSYYGHFSKSCENYMTIQNKPIESDHLRIIN